MLAGTRLVQIVRDPYTYLATIATATARAEEARVVPVFPAVVAGHQATAFSVLVVAALQLVAASPDTELVDPVVCEYLCAVLVTLLTTQINPLPLCVVLVGSAALRRCGAHSEAICALAHETAAMAGSDLCRTAAAPASHASPCVSATAMRLQTRRDRTTLDRTTLDRTTLDRATSLASLRAIPRPCENLAAAVGCTIPSMQDGTLFGAAEMLSLCSRQDGGERHWLQDLPSVVLLANGLSLCRHVSNPAVKVSDVRMGTGPSVPLSACRCCRPRPSCWRWWGCWRCCDGESVPSPG